LAFLLARLTKGDSIAACPLPRMNARSATCPAATFSVVIRRYSAAEQAPCAIKRVRRKIVSQEAAINCAISKGDAGEDFRARFRIGSI
jgi:hypothetical protein